MFRLTEFRLKGAREFGCAKAGIAVSVAISGVDEGVGGRAMRPSSIPITASASCGRSDGSFCSKASTNVRKSCGTGRGEAAATSGMGPSTCARKISKVRSLKKAKRTVERENFILCRAFWAGLLARAKDRTVLFAGRTSANGAVLSVGMGRGGFAMNTVLEQSESRVEMFFRPPGNEERSLAVFNAGHARMVKLETAFGEALICDDRPGRLGWKIYLSVSVGLRTPA